ncbi:Tat pathway signal sequence domain protein [Streptomyces sp. HPF1205]|uniref:Tat pathway signal sequence domain protein n=1 Tax=Streptomyces sp. HPF1205 TaxID=2873262 RepID=UPI001CEDF572|nr:Tat pathway signal sequence domain protein [Streptomyces sp. HPF1205]
MSNAMNRRTLLNGAVAVAGAAALSPVLSACGSGSAAKGGTNSKTGLAAALPAYRPSNAIKPDIPSVTGTAGAFTDPGFLTYPANPVKTVSGTPGKGGHYTAVTPMWGTLPPPDNSYYRAVNKALGATITMKPANGNDYATIIPTMTASRKLPDWIQLPTWWNNNFNVGELAGTQLADLTPYLAGDKIKKYPNLAAIPTLAWQAGAWQDKLYGIPSFASGMPLSGAVFYRRDILEPKGITAAQVKSAQDLWDLGKELTDAKAGVWAFDDVWTYLSPAWGVPSGWRLDDGKLVHGWETPEILEALDWHYKLAKAGFVHPDALAGNTNDQGTRFYAGKVMISGGGTGAWNLSDYQSGTTADKNYRRDAFDIIAADGKSTPRTYLGAATSIMSYLNAKLAGDQIEELLSIADYLAAPFGSTEYTLVNYGVEGVHYTMQNGAPTYTDEGKKTAQQQTYPFLASPASVVSNPGAEMVTKDYTDWCARAVKHLYKPLFYGMNITLPQRLSTAAAGQQLTDTIKDVTHGLKKVSDYQNALSAWKAAGGDQLRNWYRTNVLDKNGTGQ